MSATDALDPGKRRLSGARPIVYLDHAATSWPKPKVVLEAMARFLREAGGNPGRSGHRLAISAARIVYEAREAIAAFFGAQDPLRVVFTANVTEAINLVLRGLLRPGDRVVTSSIEHNAVMRPLRALERCGVAVQVVPCAPDGTLDLADLRSALPGARLLVLNHASNVMGTILPVAEAARLAHEAGALVLVDAAQTAGVLPIDVVEMGLDLLALTGHKGLQGPPGTGGLVLSGDLDAAEIEPLTRGGTGSHSASEEQPTVLPDRFESGTPNGVGIAGLGAGVRYVAERGVAAIRAAELALTAQLVQGLSAIDGVTVYGPGDVRQRTATVSFTVASKPVSELSYRLDDEHDVMCRVGLHCAPAAHRTIGTFPEGTVRFAAGLYTTSAEIERAIRAVACIARS